MDILALEFPERIAFGAQRRPGWNTGLVQTRSGFESSDQRWSKVRHSYDVSLAVRNTTDYGLVNTHFHECRGRAYGFLFKDHLDFTATQANGTLTLIGGSVYQLTKKYGAVNPYHRVITRPKSGTLAIYRLRSGTTTNQTANFTISYTTGQVTAGGGVVTGGDVFWWTGEFYVPCRYDVDELPTVIINREPGATGELLVQCDAIPLVEVRE